MEMILVGDVKVWENLTRDEPTTGFTRITSKKGTPIIHMPGIGRKVWLVDLQVELDVYLGGLTPTMSVLELL